MGFEVSARARGADSALPVVGILALFCCMSEFAILTPSIAAFSHHFADTDVTTIMLANSITGIVSVPVSMAVGAVLHKVGFRRAALTGILIMSLGGAFPFLLPDITEYGYVIFSRVVVGVGLGIMFPVGNATIIALYDGERRSRLLGWGITIQFVFNLIYTTVAGYLTEIGWNYSFLAYLIGLVPLVVAFLWMPEAKDVVAKGRAAEAQAAAAADAAGAENATGMGAGQGRAREALPRSVWGYALFALAGWTCVVTVQVVTSTVLDVRQLAGPGEAALVINCCGIGTILCGLVFPYLVRLFGGRLFGVSAAVVAVGIVPCLVAQSTAVYALGVFLLGFGGSAFFTAAQNATGNIAPKSRVAFVSGIMTSMMNLGPFIGPYLFAASMAAVPSMGTDTIFPVLIVIAAACAAVGLAHPMRALVQKDPAA
ncbi:MAG: MFS transporter [Eggerthellaceae bacterium]|nr:MFS transporter [Eggerthellaceae bacterium]